MYQRNYVWSEDECEQLWEDVYNFFENKEEDEEYFLGSVVIYKENGKQNIIDGQQRTTTLFLLQNCVILPIEYDGRDKALRIFNTLNNRDISLSMADIFKGLIFTNKNDKDRMEFAKEWQALENQIQNSSYLKKEDISFLFTQSQKYFAILNAFQNRLWQMVVSECFYEYKKSKNSDIFDIILPQLVAYNALGLIYGKGGSSRLFWGLMKANVNIIRENRRINIFEPSINLPDLKIPSLENFIDFSKKARPQQIRYILALYAIMYNQNQVMEWNKDNKNYSLVKAEIEYIFPRNWQNTNYNGWDEKEAQEYLEQIGNKMFLEKKLNIQAGNRYFNKKKEIYKDSYFIEARDLYASSQKD
ncbi:DUF262 domain-containing HNH endonuclease family protein [uncultured Campylobacter sp.]|uniref:DUF262 domain-containing protein n=1 Tax=uncultured Campylobacter sp. TaxID=218934 RepID=UPI0025EFD1AB|nr:DUF262 domain-containing HNH endonuclease family protein [uncultured Campylobacter sp.]